MIDYASTDGVCRSVQLLNYFGQNDSLPCGECDVCNGEHQSGIRHHDFERISATILDILNKEPMNITELVHRTKEAEVMVVKVARWMLDHEIIEINTFGIVKTALKAK